MAIVSGLLLPFGHKTKADNIFKNWPLSAFEFKDALQVDAIANKANTTCAPYMRSAKKQARRLSNVATDLVRRSSMGTASKPHKR